MHAPLPQPHTASAHEPRATATIAMNTNVLSILIHLGIVPGVVTLGIAAGCAPEAPASSPPAIATPAPARSSEAPRAPLAATPVRSAYAAVWQDFLDDFLRREPVEATGLGSHDHDGDWPDLSVEGREAERKAYGQFAEALSRAVSSGLEPSERLDAEILANKLAWLDFMLGDMRPEENDPRYYTELVGGGLDSFVTRDYAPASVRAASLAARLARLDGVVVVARARLRRPPRIMTETAIRQAKGLIGLVDGGFPELLAEAPEQRAAVLAAASKGSQALHALLAFFEAELLPRSDGDFRVGRDRLTKILRLTLDRDVDPDALVSEARALLTKTQEEMSVTARELWPTVMGKARLPDTGSAGARRAMVRRVLDRLADDRSSNATIIGDATRVLENATDFVRSHDLVSLPTQPCKVMELPEYRRGVAIAYCDWAGPLEQKAETHVSISPTPADWPKDRATSFYREYDRSMLADLMVHEAMPGHYLQGAHAAEFRATPRAVFANDAFVEGWAVYAEWLMSRYGFGGPAVRLQRQKMFARICANTILDHEIHAGTMDERAALDLMEKEAFQEEGEAVGKWTRARVTHGQLSQYMYGFVELAKMREVAERQPGFSERAYHDKILSFGAPSLHQLRAQMGI